MPERPYEETCESCDSFSCDYMKEMGLCEAYDEKARRSDPICGGAYKKRDD